MAKVTSCQMKWTPNGGAAVRFNIDNSPNWTAWVSVTSADLAAIGVILKEEEVFYDSKTGSIGTEDKIGE
jgi:hypothetical protein